MEPVLTGQKDVNLKILSDLDDKSLLKFCITNTVANKFCSKHDTELWRNRLVKKYGEDAARYKSPDKSWKQFYLQILKYWKPSKNDLSINYAMMDAAQDGHEDLVNFFISKGAKIWNWGLQGAAVGGHKELVDFFISKGGKFDFALLGAAEGGHKDLINFLISKRPKLFSWNSGLRGAAVGGHKELVDFFISKGAAGWSEGLDSAAEGGHLDLVKFFISEGADTLDDLERAVRTAFEEKHFDITDYLQALIDEKYPDRFN